MRGGSEGTGYRLSCKAGQGISRSARTRRGAAVLKTLKDTQSCAQMPREAAACACFGGMLAGVGRICTTDTLNCIVQ